LMRCALWRNVQEGGVKNGTSKEYFGVDYNGLRAWLECLFKPGMTWENHGAVWEIDHIVPLSRFDLTKEADGKAAWFYANLAPAWKCDNRKKGNRYIGTQNK
jgi:5-methylcytosine-specific restriction endonuclease McrA